MDKERIEEVTTEEIESNKGKILTVAQLVKDGKDLNALEDDLSSMDTSKIFALIIQTGLAIHTAVSGIGRAEAIDYALNYLLEGNIHYDNIVTKSLVEGNLGKKSYILFEFLGNNDERVKMEEAMAKKIMEIAGYSIENLKFNFIGLNSLFQTSRDLYLLISDGKYDDMEDDWNTLIDIANEKNFHLEYFIFNFHDFSRGDKDGE